MADPNITKHTLWLRRGDVDFLKDRFPQRGASYAIRRAVANFVDRLKDHQPSPEEIDTEDLEVR